MSECLLCHSALANSWPLAFIFSLQAFDPDSLCEQCQAAFQAIDPKKACAGCSRPQTTPILCGDCEIWQSKYPVLPLKHQALFAYNDQAREYLKTFKIQGDLLLAELFKKEINTFLKAYQGSHQIIPIPQSQKSYRERGFNQVEKLLEAAEIPYQSYLQHQGQRIKQAQKSRQERLASPQIFKWTPTDWTPTAQTKILLVDDIYTTGRTLWHAKDLIHKEIKSIAPEICLEIESFSLFR